MKSFLTILSIALLLAVAPKAHAKDEKAAESHHPAAMVHLYTSYCVVCHGEDGKGKGPLAEKMGVKPGDLTVEKYQTKKPEDLGVLIGHSGGAKRAEAKMPVWDKELASHILTGIATHVLTLPTSKGKVARDCSGKTADADRLAKGEEVYNNSCLACHGRYGNGKGLLAKLINLHDSKGKPMVDWTSKKYNKSPEAIKKAIINGQGDMMAGWKDYLCEDEADNIVVYVQNFNKKAK